MRLLFAVLTLVAVGLAGCAHQSPEARAAEQARRQKCGAIEIYPNGVTPPRPFRVLGPVSADYDGIPSHRDQTLRDRACELGADAVMDVRESNPLASQSIGGNEAAAQSEADGTAIAFTDTAAPAPAPAP
ncbi:MAG TPA: hypothetical protein VII38_02785 [Polyangia bacterium]|jgi:hypothetical protein